MSIRLLVVDEHPLMLRGIHDGLRSISDMEVVGEAGNGQAALQLVAELQPEVALMGCCLPDIPGAEVARRIREQGLPARVLAFSAHPERYYLYQMWEAGAAGYLLQTEPLETVVAAVRIVARGGAAVDGGANCARLVLADRGAGAVGEPDRAGTAGAAVAGCRIG